MTICKKALDVCRHTENGSAHLVMESDSKWGGATIELNIY